MIGTAYQWSGLILGDDNQIAPRKVAVLVALVVWCGIQLTSFLMVLATLFRMGLTDGDLRQYDHFANQAIEQALNMFMVAGGWSILHRATTKKGNVPPPSVPESQ